jgi:transcriptional regulator PpsR
MSAFSLAEPDITLHLDDHGVIREAASSSTVSDEAVETWIGRFWPDTVAGDGGHQVRRMMDDARTSGVSAFGKVIQRFPSGRELPFEYTTIRVSDRRGGMLVLGKSLQVVSDLQLRLAAAQQATEREYWKSRDIETRYRLLFDASDEAVLLVRGNDFVVMDANPAAIRNFGFSSGSVFTDDIAELETEAFHNMLRRVREHGRAPGLVLHPGTDRTPVAVRASVVAAELGLHYLLHLAPAGSRANVRPQVSKPPVETDIAADELLERLPDGFVVVGPDGLIERVNRAFLDQLGLASPGAAIGEPLGRWLSHPGADAAVLMATLRRNGTAVAVLTTIYGELGLETCVELSGAAAPGEKPQCFALLSRDIGRRNRYTATDPAFVPAGLLDAAARQLGERTLLQIVRQTSDAVENHLIKTALDRVQGNRTAAAEILGLSRQSLHAKLNRQAAGEFASESVRTESNEESGLNTNVTPSAYNG